MAEFTLTATVNGGTYSPATQVAAVSGGLYELTAGTSYSIRWGWNDTSGGSWVGNSLGTATITAWCRVVQDTRNGDSGALVSVTTGAASDTLTTTANQTTSDRSFTFVPSRTGTYRVYARVQEKNTAAAVVSTDLNTDNANFGSAAIVIPTAKQLLDFTPGLIRSGSPLTSVTLAAASPVYYPTVESIALVDSVAAEYASSGTVSYQDHTGATFASDSYTVAAGATSTADAGFAVGPANNFPAAAESVGVLITPATSALSAALGGTALAWRHFTALPSGWTGTTDAAGNYVTVSKTGAFTADPRLQVTHLMQVDDSVYGSPPMSKNRATNTRLSTEYGLLASRISAMDGTGQNGAAVTQSLQDNAARFPAEATSSTTNTQGGEIGWTNPLQGWRDGSPVGAWTMTVSVTSPTGFTGAYLVSPTIGYTIDASGGGIAPGGAFINYYTHKPYDLPTQTILALYRAKKITFTEMVALLGDR